MKMSMIALTAALSMGAAIPAFADQGPPAEASISVQYGYYYDRPGQTADGLSQNSINPIQSYRNSSVKYGYYYARPGQTADELPHAVENMGLNS